MFIVLSFLCISWAPGVALKNQQIKVSAFLFDESKIGPHRLRNNSTTLPSHAIVATQPKKNVIANVLGYLLGSVALVMYLPIMLDMIAKKSASGVSVETWSMNVVSFTLAMFYPIKKKFPLSTFIEVLALHLQSCVILGLVCFYNKKTIEFFIGSIIFASAAGLLFIQEVSSKILDLLQIFRLILDASSLMPQILMNFRNRSFSYSVITATIGAFGNSIRIFTTMQLVKDPLVLSGYIIGLLSNLILLFQYFLFALHSKNMKETI
jgi:mannose-P-dolichol utilization defect 1